MSLSAASSDFLNPASMISASRVVLFLRLYSFAPIRPLQRAVLGSVAHKRRHTPINKRYTCIQIMLYPDHLML
jgi:hypothetical protein